MQFAISGTYQQGQIHLKELPPIDEPCEVIVVFLSNPNDDFDYTEWQRNLFKDETDVQALNEKAQNYYELANKSN